MVNIDELNNELVLGEAEIAGPRGAPHSVYPLAAGQMIILKSGLSIDGFLECDGSYLNAADYPELEEILPDAQYPQSIDLGFFEFSDYSRDPVYEAVGQLQHPFCLKIQGTWKCYYVLSRRMRPQHLTELFGLPQYSTFTEDETQRTTTLNGVNIRLPTLGAGVLHPNARLGSVPNVLFSAVGSYLYFPSGIKSLPDFTDQADPTEDQNLHVDFFAILDALNVRSFSSHFEPIFPQCWPTSLYLTAGVDTGSQASTGNLAYISGNTVGILKNHSDLLGHVVLEVIQDPLEPSQLKLPNGNIFLNPELRWWDTGLMHSVRSKSMDGWSAYIKID